MKLLAMVLILVTATAGTALAQGHKPGKGQKGKAGKITAKEVNKESAYISELLENLEDDHNLLATREAECQEAGSTFDVALQETLQQATKEAAEDRRKEAADWDKATTWAEGLRQRAQSYKPRDKRRLQTASSDLKSASRAARSALLTMVQIETENGEFQCGGSDANFHSELQAYGRVRPTGHRGFALLIEVVEGKDAK